MTPIPSPGPAGPQSSLATLPPAAGVSPQGATTESPRPVFAPTKVQNAGFPGTPEPQQVTFKDRASPMGLILEALSRPTDQNQSAGKAPLVPPVPLRYLSAFMLQSEPTRGDYVDQRL